MQLALGIKIKFGAVALQHAFADPLEVFVELLAKGAGAIKLANFDAIDIFIGYSLIRYIHHLIDRLGEWPIHITIHHSIECEIKWQGCGDVVGCSAANAHFTARSLHEVGVACAQP